MIDKDRRNSQDNPLTVFLIVQIIDSILT